VKQLVAVATFGLMLFSSPAHTQLPPGADPNTVLPEDGAPKAIPGSYKVTSAAAFGNDGLRVFQPADLNAFPKRDKLPVVVWGNGGCAIDAPRYSGLLETIASHGFLVITTAAASAAPDAPRRTSATSENLKAGIDWAEKENARAGSPLSGKINLKQVAAMGQSCGGRLSLELNAADPRVKAIGVFNAGIKPDQYAVLARLHGPVLFINGHERDFMMVDSKATYDAIDKLPAFYGARHGAGHTATAYHAGGGEFANVASNWLRWQFKKDKKAGKMFVGKKCGLCTDENWDIESKRLK
jgi:dienelactone hydrolase